jgi:hypothetical protein
MLSPEKYGYCLARLSRIHRVANFREFELTRVNQCNLECEPRMRKSAPISGGVVGLRPRPERRFVQL